MSCSCYTGQAVQDKNGDCFCISNANPPHLPPQIIDDIAGICTGVAPNGYQYLMENGRCVMVPKYEGNPAIYGPNALPVIVVRSETASASDRFYEKHPILSLIAVGVAVGFISNKLK